MSPCTNPLTATGNRTRSTRTFLLLALCLLPLALRADDKFLRDYAETRGFMLGRPVAATPTPDGSAVLFLRAKSSREPSQELYEFSVASSQTRRLLSPDDALRGAAEHLSPEEKARRERQRISVGGFTAFSISKDSALVLLSLSGKLYVLHRADGTVTELATGPGTIVDPKFTPDNRGVAYVRNQDVCLYDLASGKEHTVTTGGTETLAHGLAEFVAQEEFDRFTGYWVSPDSQFIAYQENDASRVESWFVADPSDPGVEPERVAYPRPGKPNVAVRVGIAPAAGGGETVWLDWDRVKYPYLGKATWTADGPLTLTVLSRDQTDLALLAADPATGKTRILLLEHDDAWINLDHDMPRWLSEKDGGGFLWTAERAADWQLERRKPDGNLDRVILQARHGYRGFVGVSGGVAFYLGGDNSYDDFRPGPAWDQNVRSVSLTGETTPVRMNPKLRSGRLTVHPSDSDLLFTAQRETGDELSAVEVHRFSDLGLAAVLPSVAEAPPFVVRPTFESIVLDQKPPPFRAVLIKPQADAKQRLPVIVDVYGGPGYQQVHDAFRPYLLDQWLADQGFIVVAIDGRGTPGRGRDWERAIAGHFGSVPLDDQVAVLRALGGKHPEMDLDRVGITGWSFGGYMSALAVLRRPDFFKAAVAGAPVVDWMDYDTAYTERYLGVPGAGRWPDAYKEGSLLTYAADLQRPLLLIHGTADDNVYFRHSLRLADALFRAGKPFDFLPLDHFTHMVPDPVVRARLEERIVNFFHAHLAAAAGS